MSIGAKGAALLLAELPADADAWFASMGAVTWRAVCAANPGVALRCPPPFAEEVTNFKYVTSQAETVCYSVLRNFYS